MAGAGWKQWTRERLTAADLQSYIQDQVIMQFDSAAQRQAVLPASGLSDGMVCYLEDKDDFEYREQGGSYWRPLGNRWPDHTSGSLPSGNGLRNGEIVWSSIYACTLMYGGGGNWRQATVAQVGSIASFISGNLTANGITGPHNGFLVYETTTNRLFVFTGGLNYRLLAGPKDASRTITGFPTVSGSGWSYVSGGSTWIRALGNGTATVNLEVTKTGTGLAIPTDGNITNGQVGQVPPGFEPLESTPLTSSGTGRVVHGYIGTGGDIVMTAVAFQQTIAVGENCSLAGNFMLADPTK